MGNSSSKTQASRHTIITVSERVQVESEHEYVDDCVDGYKESELREYTAPAKVQPVDPEHQKNDSQKKMVQEHDLEEPDRTLIEVKRDMKLEKILGKTCSVVDTRLSKTEAVESFTKPQVRMGELYKDKTFPLEIAMEGEAAIRGVMLKRPGEFCQQPTLFSDGTTRFDVEQGGAGTCSFLSILSSLADNGEAIKQIIPDDAYPIGSDKYSGVFHCKLWRFGQWVDVYVDDLLPVKLYGSEFKLWGAKSTDDREMWVSLMEKAFARFKGGYANVYGGLPGDAFTTLTGGVAELVEIPDTDAATLYSRMKNALSCGSIITCSCPKSSDGIKGLVGNHAYTITGTFRINHRAQSKMLLRLRNPWGTKGEWKGDWSDKSYLWNDVTDSVKEKMKVNKKMDGEFWMTMADFMSHFCRVSICNFTPDFDQDGKEDSLNQMTCVLGEWTGDTAAGYQENRKFNNPKFTFTVPKKGLDEDGKMPVVVQILGKTKPRTHSNISFSLKLYKIEREMKKDNRLHLVLYQLDNDNVFNVSGNHCHRYRLQPGEYLAMPLTRDQGDEAEFCMRFFAPVGMKCREITPNPALYVYSAEKQFVLQWNTYLVDKIQVQCGAWEPGGRGGHFGGPVHCSTFYRNPQYFFNIPPDTNEEPLLVCILQLIGPPIVPIGCVILPIPPGSPPLPWNYQTICWSFDNHARSTKGNFAYVAGCQAEAHYLLKPGNYVLLVFAKEPNFSKEYALVMGTRQGSKINLKLCN